MTDPRSFNASQRAALYLAADGRCTRCDVELPTGWHADHEIPYSAAGPTDVVNGQALCPTCNLLKGDSVTALRGWQQDALDVLAAGTKNDYLITATPGAGKTTFALTAARKMLDEGTVTRVVVIVPTDSLRLQWADNAGKLGIQLKPAEAPEDYDKSGYRGCVATYAQLGVGAGRDLMRRAMRHKTLVILDEVHHAGLKKAWGDGLQHAVELAAIRLALTGTPWRRDATSPIPFVEYDRDGQVVVDYAYEYGAAVADGVCRRIEFYAWDGEAKWIDHGRPASTSNRWARLGADTSVEDISTVLDGVYDPGQQWMPVVLKEAHKALEDLRAEVTDAAGLIIAEKMHHARAYAKLLRDITGIDPVVVVSDDPAAKDAIDRFRNATSPWIVAVRMVSEGVDIPRLAIGVYASKYMTPLFFRQVAGRFVRTRDDEEINARLFMPAVPVLMEHAREIEEELRHQLELETQHAAADGAVRGESGQQGELPFRTIVSAGDALLDRAIVAGEDATPEEVAACLATARQIDLPAKFALNLLPLIRGSLAGGSATAAAAASGPVADTPQHRQEKLLRGRVKALANKYAFRTGQEEKNVNAALIREGIPPRKKATIADLERALAILERWLAGQP